MVNHEAQTPPDKTALRPAATVMLVRDLDDATDFEVLMVRRNLNSDFVGGAYVFPGGGVDMGDAGAAIDARSPARGDKEASAILGVDQGGLAYWVAVLRECFEEAGVLLATTSDGEMLTFADTDVEARFAAHRDALNARATSFVAICEEEDLQLATEHVHYFAHWITPEGSPRRYDTRFFVAAAPRNQIPVHDASEVIDSVWVTPTKALELHRRGEIELIFPTIKNLQAISRFSSTDALLEAAATAGSIPEILPRISVTERGVFILLPGDPGYDEAVRPEGISEPGTFNEVIAQISARANSEEPAAPPTD